MDWCQSIAERKIRQALEAGAFDHLPHRGKPIPIEINPFEDPSQWMAHHLLRVNGFAPAWIEDSKDIHKALDEFRRALEQARAIQDFRERGAELNRRILTHNLKTPSMRFHLRPLDVEAEIATALAGSAAPRER